MRSSLALLLVLAGCGSLNDLSLDAPPVATLKGRVSDLARVRAAAGPRKVHATLVWGALPSIHPICLTENRDDSVCVDPFSFFPGALDAAVEVPLDGDGSFEVPLRHLPPASAVIGTIVDHVAYGSVVISIDRDDNGRFDFPLGRSEWSDRRPNDDEEIPVVDLPVEASFSTLRRRQHRVAFSQGDFDTLGLFYPSPGCAPPADGFSLLRTNAYTATSRVCEPSDLSESLELHALDADEGLAFACRALRTSGRTRRPPMDEPKRSVRERICKADGEILILVWEGACPQFNVYALKGCDIDLRCEEPEWDFRASPPAWWPCER
jgi:hypothetical protein